MYYKTFIPQPITKIRLNLPAGLRHNTRFKNFIARYGLILMLFVRCLITNKKSLVDGVLVPAFL